MKRIIPVVFVAAMIMATVMGVACRDGVEKPADQVSVQLKWIHQAQFAGFYTADQKGFYAEENIDLTLNAGGPDIPPEKMVDGLIAGETTFAIVGGEQVIAARAQGKPIVAIATIFQRNPYVYVSLKDSGITRPQDLVGKKVMVPSGVKIQRKALLKKLGIDPDTIIQVPYQRDVTPLATGQIDAHMVYRTGLGLAFDETGYELNFIWMDDYGIRLYSDTIVTTEQLVQQNPELVERFLRATLKGWRYAIENAAEAVEMTLQYDATLSRKRQARMMAAQTPLIHTGDVNIGWMDRRVWADMQYILFEQGVIAREEIKQIEIDKVFTMQFLNKIYGKAKEG